jgi:hypothetical protein
MSASTSSYFAVLFALVSRHQRKESLGGPGIERHSNLYQDIFVFITLQILFHFPLMIILLLYLPFSIICVFIEIQ